MTTLAAASGTEPQATQHGRKHSAVAVVMNSSYQGGSELAMAETISCLHEAGYAVHVIMPDEGPLRDKLVGQCTAITIINHNWWMQKPPILSAVRRAWFLKGYLLSASAMARYFRAHHISLVITNSVAIPSGALAARMASLRHVWYLHEFGEEDHGFKFWYGKQRSFRYINAWSDHCIANSQAIYDYFRHYIPGHKLSKVYYSVDMPATAAPVLQAMQPGEPLRCIITGRVAPGKRQLDAVKAVQQLHLKGLPITLTVQGSRDEHYGHELDQYITTHKLDNIIRFVPHTAQPHLEVQAHHVALVCSQREAFGRVTVEAMKLGIPLVATNTAGSLELLGADGQRGLLYEPGDVDALAEHIESYFEDAELRHRMAAQAWSWAWRNCNRQVHTQAITNILAHLPIR